MYALDNETHLITRSDPAPRVVCTTLYDGDSMEDPILLKSGDTLHQRWKELLIDPEIKIVGHNIAYDMCTAISTYPDLKELIFNAYENQRITDTGIRQQLFDIAVGRIQSEEDIRAYSLASLAKLLFGENMSGKKSIKDDSWRLRYAELEDVPENEWPEAAVSYAKNDARMTWRIWNAQQEAQEYIRDEYNTAYSFFCLALMQNRGMRTDADAVRRCEDHHKKTMADLVPGLECAELIEWNPRTQKYVKKMKRARELIEETCTEKGIDVPTTPKGLVATDKAACLISGNPDMLDRVKYAAAEKIMSTYIPTLWAGTEGMITTRFGLAATGRVTSKTPGKPLEGANLQQIPRKGGVRECYVPREGYVYLAADFTGAELHTLAQVCLETVGYSTMGERLNRGDDLHLAVAAEKLGITYEEALTRYVSGDPEIKEARQDAKAANFGFPGGLQARGFVNAQLKQREEFWTLERATTLREAWLSTFPEMPEYIDFCKEELGPQSKTMIEIGVEKRLRTVDRPTVNSNNKFQGRAALGGLSAVRSVTRGCHIEVNSKLYGAFPCNFVHDEIIAEIPLLSDLHGAAMEMKTRMETEFSKQTPDYPVSVEPVLMGYWSKDAEPVFDSEGRLTIWNG